MFDIGFSELLIIAVVALLVLGPERLPKAARFAGLWVRRARSHWHSVKSEFENELASEDLQRTLRETREALRSAEDELRGGATTLQAQLTEAQAELEETRAQIAREPGAAPAQDHPQGEGQQEQRDDEPEMRRSQVDHALLEPPPPQDEDDDGVLVEPGESGEHADAMAEPSPQTALPFPSGETEAPDDARR